ncbi:MAG TPA: glycosyltransferase family 2 protein [Vicinamibacteria bacterium]|nr:glycosyltransferase family 2 protein [Vicinamibacteria bacterium]
MRTLTVVCPACDEQETIADFHAELRRALVSVAGRWSSTVLYVVDGGTDRTLDILRQVAAADPAVRVLALSARFGQQAAILAGLDHCDSDAVVMMDSDLQHPPAVVPELLAVHERGYDVVYTVGDGASDTPLAKRLTARWFYRLLSALAETPIHEGAADFRLVSRRVVQVFQRGIRERGLFLRGLFVWVGFPSCAVPFRVAPRRAGRTKYSFGRMLRFGLGGIVAFSRVPLRAAAGAGALVLGLGLAASGWGVWGLVRAGSPPPWALPLALFGLVSGAQLVFLGILGEYLGAVLDEVRARPHYVVAERIGFEPGP